MMKSFISPLKMLLVIALTAMAPSVSADSDTKDPIKIQSSEARQHVDQQVEVIFEVKASKYSAKRKTAFLDSEENFRDSRNLGIAISEQGLEDLKNKRAVANPADHYRGKTIRVTGKVVLREEHAYIDVTLADQIDLAPVN